MAPFVLPLVKTAASLGILCLGIVDRRREKGSSTQDSVGDEYIGLRENPSSFEGPWGIGLRRDDRESIAVSSCGVVCVSKPGTLLLHVYAAA